MAFVFHLVMSLDKKFGTPFFSMWTNLFVMNNVVLGGNILSQLCNGVFKPVCVLRILCGPEVTEAKSVEERVYTA